MSAVDNNFPEIFLSTYPGKLPEQPEISSYISDIFINENGQIIKSSRSLSWTSLISETNIFLNVNHPNIIKAEKIYLSLDNGGTRKVQYVLPQLKIFDLEVISTWPKDKIKRVCYQIIDALAFLEEHGIYHGDIKVTNILLDENDNAVLIDFGLMFYHLNQNSSQITQSYCDDGKLEHMRGINNNYDKIATAMYCLGILLFYVIVPDLDDIPDFSKLSVLYSSINDSNSFVDKWITDTTDLEHLIGVIKRLLGPISSRPKTFVELLDPEYVRATGTYRKSRFEEKRKDVYKIDAKILTYSLRVIYDMIGSCDNDLVTFEMTVEIFSKYYSNVYFPQKDHCDLKDYIKVCLRIAQSVFHEKCVCEIPTTCYDMFITILQRSNFNFVMNLRTLEWGQKATLCWIYAIKWPSMWREDILRRVEKKCVKLNIPICVTDGISLKEWLGKFIVKLEGVAVQDVLVTSKDITGCVKISTVNL